MLTFERAVLTIPTEWVDVLALHVSGLTQVKLGLMSGHQVGPDNLNVHSSPMKYFWLVKQDFIVSKVTQVKLGFNVWSPAGWHLAFADRAAAAEMPTQEEVGLCE